MKDEPRVVVRVLRLIDDGPPKVIEEMLFSNVMDGLRWTRTVLGDALMRDDKSIAVSITEEIG
jgi:hypothetical protein